ncbi:glycoprotease family-domain-containing protein [Neohortaea acidophila]|uniref:N(6)-L-threonylcarbamoyladenine synthase n=1 Tax=Neohortaea acidophila TaxID=245834 RepID=A0A6A6PQ98_9PEZI|nr:glycoprotease family-domain-containing protein [Neohortaea acidophila]KAF2482182.1 glycoprotease family-domain-containing protein [Neohortaea acidophila]
MREGSTLAIETSCDDTSVAVLVISGHQNRTSLRSEVLFHEKITANSHSHGGIHPLVALDSHTRELGGLVQKALRQLALSPARKEWKPDFVSVTRGPGMRSNLNVGLHVAKGLALAWNVPLVGVHHMQAHALTARLCATLEAQEGMGRTDLRPRFPFLSLLVSGGHTMLIDSQALVDHRILVETQDIAIGDFLDKAARAILTEAELKAPYGRALETFADPSGSWDYSWYTPPEGRQQELDRRPTEYGWSLGPPLADSKFGEKSNRRMIYSFSGLLSTVQRLTGRGAKDGGSTPMSTPERRELAREAQRVAFEHLGSRILLYLQSQRSLSPATPLPEMIVVSGGVASNQFLRHVLRSMLDVRGYSNIQLLFPPVELCTDNALMIAWAGMEMFDAGHESELSIEPLRKWSMDPAAEDGGILGVGGWSAVQRPGHQE